jgi:DNA-binding response OmpR family regulator
MACKLLVVDDEIELMTILVKHARERGYEANGSLDTADVLQQVRTIAPHVVLLDLRMPRVDGRDLLARIAAEPCPPSVIVMSGWVDEFTCELCRGYGAVDVVHKPFDLDDLFRRIDAAAMLAGPR